jgi:putative phosphoribosyl transferase
MFEDREDAGRQLALEIGKKLKDEDFIVAAILRGGIVLGRIIADYFKASLEPLAIRKIGAPDEKELAIGALGPNNTVFWEKGLLARIDVDRKYKTEAVKEKSYELEELEKVIGKNKGNLDFANKKVIVVDDGVATGTTVLCAHMYLKKEKAKSIILAAPVIAGDTFKIMNKYFGKVVALKVAPNFHAVGQFYKYFPQVSDEEVAELL